MQAQLEPEKLPNTLALVLTPEEACGVIKQLVSDLNALFPNCSPKTYGIRTFNLETESELLHKAILGSSTGRLEIVLTVRGDK